MWTHLQWWNQGYLVLDLQTPSPVRHRWGFVFQPACYTTDHPCWPTTTWKQYTDVFGGFPTLSEGVWADGAVIFLLLPMFLGPQHAFRPIPPADISWFLASSCPWLLLNSVFPGDVTAPASAAAFRTWLWPNWYLPLFQGFWTEALYVVKGTCVYIHVKLPSLRPFVCSRSMVIRPEMTKNGWNFFKWDICGIEPQILNLK